MFTMGSIGALIVLILNVWAIVAILGSAEPTGAKVFWIVVVLLLPVLGFIIWFVAGPSADSAKS